MRLRGVQRQGGQPGQGTLLISKGGWEFGSGVGIWKVRGEEGDFGSGI